jgi:cytochrome b561
MSVRNGVMGYGVVTKFLHWLTVAALAAQFTLGYAQEGLSEWLTETDSSGRGSGDADEALVFAHGWLGGAIVALALVRLLWRTATPLPPWAEQLTARDRKLAHRTEQLLYLLLFLVPGSGLALLFLSGEEREIGPDEEWQPPYDVIDDDVLLATHIAGHILFYLALIVHVGLAVRRRTLGRMF